MGLFTGGARPVYLGVPRNRWANRTPWPPLPRSAAAGREAPAGAFPGRWRRAPIGAPLSEPSRRISVFIFFPAEGFSLCAFCPSQVRDAMLGFLSRGSPRTAPPPRPPLGPLPWRRLHRPALWHRHRAPARPGPGGGEAGQGHPGGGTEACADRPPSPGQPRSGERRRAGVSSCAIHRLLWPKTKPIFIWFFGVFFGTGV